MFAKHHPGDGVAGVGHRVQEVEALVGHVVEAAIARARGEVPSAVVKVDGEDRGAVPFDGVEVFDLAPARRGKGGVVEVETVETVVLVPSGGNISMSGGQQSQRGSTYSLE